MIDPQSAETRGEAAKSVSVEERERMIAQAAYFRAQQRNFADGDPVADWLEAEQQIDQVSPAPRQREEDAVVYEKLRRLVGNAFSGLREAIDEQAVRQAFDQATEELKKSGAHTAQTVSRIAASLRKDLADAAHAVGPDWQRFSEKSADLLDVWRDRSAVFAAEAARSIGQWLQQTGTELREQTYRSGETVHQGAFSCLGCGERVELSTSGHLSPCPTCHATEYRRA